jgi:hypothetical protein
MQSSALREPSDPLVAEVMAAFESIPRYELTGDFAGV